MWLPWLASATRWIQFGFLVTSTMLVGRASRIILDHEYKSAKLNRMHATNWGEALDYSREKHDVASYGDGVWFIIIIIVWVLVAAIITIKVLSTRPSSWITQLHHIRTVQAGIIIFLCLGLYLFVLSIIIANDFTSIKCSLDHSARHLIDATETDVYATCAKQDYTQDLFNGVFSPLFILLTLELILVALTHWKVEVEEVKALSLPTKKSNAAANIDSIAPVASRAVGSLFF